MELLKPKEVVGKNTVHSMQSGIFYGYVGLVDEMVRKIREETRSDPKVVATGGLARLIAPESQVIDEVLHSRGSRLSLSLIFQGENDLFKAHNAIPDNAPSALHEKQDLLNMIALWIGEIVSYTNTEEVQYDKAHSHWRQNATITYFHNRMKKGERIP